jgi:phenylacetate-coenzyme A ligase PaaK-like adenylate-forming protein
VSPARLLRSFAYDIMCRRDGAAGWKQGRAQFRALAASSSEEIHAVSLARLRRLLAHAAATVPYYRDMWHGIGFDQPRTATVNDLRRLPILTKADIREQKNALVSSAVHADDLVPALTGGTSGTQTEFYRDRRCHVVRFGRQWGILERCGYRPGDRRALVWGVHDDLPGTATGLKQWFRRFAAADEVLCCTVMTTGQMFDYHRRLRRFRPTALYGYPNAIEQFARFIEQERLSKIAVGQVLCTAERLHDSQRVLFQDVFGGEVFNLYASREHGVVGFECERHRGFHIDAGSVVVEILCDRRPAMPGESGEIVVTDLLNYGMPLIRYATGDVATAPVAPCDCGCPLPIFSGLDGRVSDILYRPDGSRVAGLMLDDLFVEKPNITHAQFVQEDAGSLDVRLVLKQNADATPDLQRGVIEEVRSIMGPDIIIRLHYLPDIPRNPRSGKFQLTICKIQGPARGTQCLSLP